MMKISIFILFVCVFQVLAENSKAQNATIHLPSVHMTVGQLIDEIEHQTNYLVVFSNSEVNTEQTIQVKNKSARVSDYLQEVFEDNNLKYQFENNYIILSRKTIQPQDIQQTEKRVAGTIKDAAGEPIIGVSIAIKGTSRGTVSDIDGAFSLTVPEDAVLAISYVGYTRQEIRVGGQTNINVILQEDAQLLDELVVVGFGTQKKLNLTGAISSVKGEDMAIRPLANTASMLQGQVAGLYVTQSTGQPGEENVTFNIRGNGSYGSSTAPLILINGVEGDITGLDPNIIENISVLKDAASAAIYGSRAANGVILVTTKQGSPEKKPKISYSGVFSIHTPTKMYDLVTNSVEYMTLVNLAKDNSGQGSKYPEEEIEKYRKNGGSDQYPNFDWLDYMFNSAFMHTHNISLAGSTEKTTYNMSLNYLNQEGTLRGHDYKRYNFTVDFSSWATDWMRVGTFITLRHGDRMKTRQNQDDAFLSTMSQAPTYMPWLPDDGTGVRKWTNSAYSYEGHNKNMPAIVGEGIMAPRKDYDVNGQIWAEIKFLKYFTWNTKAATRYYSYRNSDWRGKDTPIYMFHTGEQSGVLDKGGLGLAVDERRDFSTTLQSYLRFDFSPNSVHNLSAMIGYSQETYKQETLLAYRRDYPFDLKTINAGGQTAWTNGGNEYEWALQSLYGRFTYNYKERYLLEANARYDGSSKLSPGSRWGLFPSFSGAWRLSEEGFFDDTLKKWFSYAKIRGSWGELGNQDIGNYPYQAMIASVSSYPFDKSTQSQAYIQTAFNNEYIQWEKTTIADVGADFSFFNHLNATFDWYKKTTSDILRTAQVSGILGLTAPTINGGKMQNTGIELSLEWNDKVRAGTFKGLTYFAGANFGRSRNKLLEFGPEAISGNNIRREGLPYNEFYMLKCLGVFATQEEIDNSPKQFTDRTQPGDLKFADISGPGGVPDGIINNYDRTTLSGYYPGFEYSVKIGGNWKGFDLFIFGQGVQGKKFFMNNWGVTPFFQGSSPTREYLKGMWTPENPYNAKYPKLYMGDLGGSKNTRGSSFFLQDASYFRIKNITLGYTIPKPLTDKIGMSRLRVYISGDNILTFTDFNGLDPERTSNGTAAQYPQNKSFSLGLNVEF